MSYGTEYVVYGSLYCTTVLSILCYCTGRTRDEVLVCELSRTVLVGTIVRIASFITGKGGYLSGEPLLPPRGALSTLVVLSVPPTNKMDAGVCSC